jgi:hypothetical protein
MPSRRAALGLAYAALHDSTLIFVATTSFEFLFEKGSVLGSNDSPELTAEVENIGGHQVTIFFCQTNGYSKGAVRFVKGR